MIQLQKEELRAMLVRAGFWDATAQYDPTRNWIALEELTEKIQKSLAEAACLFVFPLNADSQSYQVILSYKEDEDLTIGLGKDVYDAVCRAALTLPALFAEHPEYTANGRFDDSIFSQSV